MDLPYLDSEDYKDIPLLKMADNNHDGLPFFMRKYIVNSVSTYSHFHRLSQILNII